MPYLVTADIFNLKLDRLRQILNAHLREYGSRKEPFSLYEPVKYVLDGGGKRIRPILLILSCQAVGGNPEMVYDAAIAVELLHNFTLVHDDIMDRDDTRRGRPTVHKKWDIDTALLAGDGLVALAYRALLRTHSQRIAEVAATFTDGLVELCEGQALDREFESRANVRPDEYLQMIEKKTASLLSVSTKMGAILGNGDAEEVQALREFGLNLGRAFQIQDDLLDITANEKILGKTYGSDILRRKQTYLLVHALSNADASHKKIINSFLLKPDIDKEGIAEIKALYKKIGSIEAAEEAVKGYIHLAQMNLAKIPVSQSRDDLLEFLDYISNRSA